MLVLGCLLNKALAALITMGLSLLWMMMLLWYRDVLGLVGGVLVSVGGVLLLVDWVVCFLFWMRGGLLMSSPFFVKLCLVNQFLCIFVLVRFMVMACCKNTQEQEAQKAKKAKKWFKIKTNSKFSQGLSLFQIPQIFIITELSNENFDLASSLGKNNNIVIYYNAKNNEIDYLYGQQNDIEVNQIEYRIIANGKIINTLVEDTTNGEYITDTDDDPKDDIDTQARCWCWGVC
jgi:hypothetical protein